MSNSSFCIFGCIFCHPKNILATLIKYSIHMDEIILSMWKIFGLHGKNILKRLYVAHKSYAHMLATHRSQAHWSCSQDSCVRIIQDWSIWELVDSRDHTFQIMELAITILHSWSTSIPCSVLFNNLWTNDVHYVKM